VALDDLARSNAVAEMGAALGDLDQAQFEWFQAFTRQLGPACLDVLVPVYSGAHTVAARDRLEAVIAQMGDAGAVKMGTFIDGDNWSLCRAAIRLLARIGGPQAVAALQPLARDRDVRRAREAIVALACVNDPGAARTILVLLKAGSDAARQLAIDALVESREKRALAVLAQALTEADVLGRDHHIVLRILEALPPYGDERLVAAIASIIRPFRWTLYWRAKRLKRAGTRLLFLMRSQVATKALEQAERDGDFLLRSLARAALRRGGR
jgi:HEAT repeat protein